MQRVIFSSSKTIRAPYANEPRLGPLPHAEQLAASTLALPLYVGLATAHVDEVVIRIREFYEVLLAKANLDGSWLNAAAAGTARGKGGIKQVASFAEGPLCQLPGLRVRGGSLAHPVWIS